MQKQYWNIALVIGLAAATQTYCKDYWGYLTHITNNSGHNMTITSSDTEGFIELNDGSRPNIQNQKFDLSNVKYMYLAIPQEGWDGDAAITLTVLDDLSPAQPKNPIKIQYTVTDRNGVINVTYESFKWGKTGKATGSFDHSNPVFGWISQEKKSVFSKSKYNDRATEISITVSDLSSDGVTAAVVN